MGRDPLERRSRGKDRLEITSICFTSHDRSSSRKVECLDDYVASPSIHPSIHPWFHREMKIKGGRERGERERKKNDGTSLFEIVDPRRIVSLRTRDCSSSLSLFRETCNSADELPVIACIREGPSSKSELTESRRRKRKWRLCGTEIVSGEDACGGGVGGKRGCCSGPRSCKRIRICMRSRL